MEIKYHKNFLKNYRLRIKPQPNLIIKFKQRLDLFIANPKNPILKDHKLIGKGEDYRAFSITGDIRVVYKIFDNQILLYDIGSHNQVY